MHSSIEPEASARLCRVITCCLNNRAQGRKHRCFIVFIPGINTYTFYPTVRAEITGIRIESKDPAPLLIYGGIEEPKTIVKDLIECSIEVKQGLTILECSRLESLIELVLRLIEAGVSPLTPSTWICGPSRELGMIAFTEPSRCPEISAESIVVGCRSLALCTKAYTVLESGRKLLVKRRRGCFTASIELTRGTLLPQVVRRLFVEEKLLGDIFILSPLVIPWFPRGRGIWVNGCLR